MITAAYSPLYFAPTPTASMRKLPVVAEQVQKLKLARLVDVEKINPLILYHLHSPEYVDAFLRGHPPLASSSGFRWSEQIRDGVLAIQNGQLIAAKAALKEGIAANIAQGFHHAGYERGSGYCTFNGLALVALMFPQLRIGVLDCDEHQGNGTAEFTTLLDNLFNVTIYGSYCGADEELRSENFQVGNCRGKFKKYRTALEQGLDHLSDWKADLVIYQAGVDPHINDPLGSVGLSSANLRLRDRIVFQYLKSKGIPVFFVLAGGYQEPIETALAPLHVATFQEAYDTYCK